MQNTIKVTTPDQFLAAATQSEAATTALFTINKKAGKDADKKYKGGTQFLNVKWHGLNGAAKSEGWFSLTDIPIQAISDPSKKKPGTEDNKPQISSKVSDLGDFGKALMIAQKQWVAAVKVLEDSKAIPKRKVHDLAQLTISENAAENAGAALEDPIFRGKISDYGDNFPPTYPVSILANKPKTEIFDYRTGRVVDGKPVYDLATVEDDSGKRVPVSFANIHKFVTRGSVMRYGRLMMSSVAVSGNWTSMQCMYTKLIIEPGAPAVFGDDDSVPLPSGAPIINSAVSSVSSVSKVTTHTASEVSVPNDNNVPPAAAATYDEINEALSEL
jgi:hypothetical protein